ncbi:uncharacterized protein LOC134276552 [Saccostrea cucullata]|uniref:uncharacterized protein LOC134276552 n=1 Tax=Saccostrea cuccullata TaxID=36930 RepID=UPI002ED1DF04
MFLLIAEIYHLRKMNAQILELFICLLFLPLVTGGYYCYYGYYYYCYYYSSYDNAGVYAGAVVGAIVVIVIIAIVICVIKNNQRNRVTMIGGGPSTTVTNVNNVNTVHQPPPPGYGFGAPPPGHGYGAPPPGYAQPSNSMFGDNPAYPPPQYPPPKY